MSLPFFLLHCTDCEYCTNFYYDTKYKFHGTGFSPLLTTSWCHCCVNLATVAEPVNEKNVESEIQELHKLCEKERKPIFGFIPRHRTSEKEKIFEQQISHLRQSIDFFKNRKMEATCLQCGEKETEEFDIKLLDSKNPVDIGIYHWNCGGRILVNQAGRISYEEEYLPVVEYDIDGHIVSDGRSNVSQIYVAEDSLDIQKYIEYIISDNSRYTLNGLASQAIVAILNSLHLQPEHEDVISDEVTALFLFITVKNFINQTGFAANSSVLTTQLLTSEPWASNLIGTKKQKLRQYFSDLLHPYVYAMRNNIKHPENLPHEVKGFGEAAAKIIADSLLQKKLFQLSNSQIDSLGKEIYKSSGALYFAIQALNEHHALL